MKRTSRIADEEIRVQSADVFPAGRRLESLLVRETDTGTDGVAALFAATDARVDEAFERISNLEQRLQQLETPAPVAAPSEAPYIVFLATPDGYRLVEAFGSLPRAGERLWEDSEPAEVLRVGISPYPGDSRPCAFAVTTALPSADAAEAHDSLDRRAA